MTVLALAALAPAHASAVSGCRYTGPVEALTDDGPRTMVTLRVSAAEAFGHSGAPAVCAAAGEVVTLAVPDASLGPHAVVVGTVVRAEVTDVWNPPDHVHTEEVVAVVPAAAAACSLDGTPACLDLAVCAAVGPRRFDLPMGSVTVQVLGPVGEACGMCVQRETENPSWTWTECAAPTCRAPRALGRLSFPSTPEQGPDLSALTRACATP